MPKEKRKLSIPDAEIREAETKLRGEKKADLHDAPIQKCIVEEPDDSDVASTDSQEEVIDDVDAPMEDEDMEEVQSADAMADPTPPKYQLFRPTVDTLEAGETLEMNEDYYSIYYKFGLGQPCYCFDIVPDALGAIRTRGPHTMTMVAGTQTEQSQNNYIIVAKASDIHRTYIDEEADDEEDASDDGSDEGRETDPDKPPTLQQCHICVNSEVNALKVSPHNNWLVSAYTEDAKVRVYSIQAHLKTVDNPAEFCSHNQPPLYMSSDHTAEGFALDWCPLKEGVLASGSRDQTVRILEPTKGGFISGPCLRGHTGSVEGLAWKGDDPNVLASGSTDKSIIIWDLRTGGAGVKIAKAHDGDVNTLSFNKVAEPYHLLSGGDDGRSRVRDIRMSSEILASFDWHTQPVCGVDWHPTDGSMYLSAGYDDQVVIWSLDVEAETEAKINCPEQLLFQHLGLEEVRAARWHPQIPGLVICNGSTGFSMFKPINDVFGKVA
eukprot:Blabericola_migrator_1__12099@NODE_745_length_6664_cov_146_664090_g535_i0_p2_GENE_NODE_745_length_6664_cov_146_664090_g535_i0NODE_745_length_6664_cov_146_664090_g535_i0_p2_ORF_typecomplete_len493_score88_66WD40/PF00400_32/0_014WD40/PF00400_32/0_29WD40/PF00400_32/3e07WD40/PF00400_32/2_1WD40/PF00400_32/0_0014ANAPC4_WD40/PF12894_7/0_76ANAPC4_WD40/PF12894_7/0_00079ANAPC4_WD40/PF12894_7/1e07ANAPC4_WD40/PF12894_7/0_002Ge1_WD40/PF16529_5/1_3Ge1_WD40/PF16529_5/6_9e02Ge1_WD40/PF16529_5/0_0036Ge1_WD40/PF1